MQRSDGAEKFYDLNEAMNEYYGARENENSDALFTFPDIKLEVGNIVAAKYSEDNQWYRAAIIRSDASDARVSRGKLEAAQSQVSIVL